MNRRINLTHLAIALLAALAIGVLAACSSAGPAMLPPSSAPTLANSPAQNQTAPQPGTPGAGQVQVVVVPSELVVGPDRFAVGIIDPAKGMIQDATVHFTYYELSNGTASVESQADATRESAPGTPTTIYTHEREFKHAGNWGVQVDARYADGTILQKRIGFQVIDKSPTRKVGDKVPGLDTAVATPQTDLHKLTSSTRPNPAFYKISLANALMDGKPTIVLFSTPAYCTSRLCGPAYDATTELQTRYGDKLNYVAVEVYTGLPNPADSGWQLDPAMQAFGLQTEPWLYLVDKSGTIAYRVEGLFTADEVDRHIQDILK